MCSKDFEASETAFELQVSFSNDENLVKAKDMIIRLEACNMACTYPLSRAYYHLDIYDKCLLS